MRWWRALTTLTLKTGSECWRNGREQGLERGLCAPRDAPGHQKQLACLRPSARPAGRRAQDTPLLGCQAGNKSTGRTLRFWDRVKVMGKLGSPGKSCASGEPSGRGALRKHACSALWAEPPSGRVSELFALLVRLRGHHPTCPSPQSEEG